MRHIVVALAAVAAGVLVLVRAGPIAASLTGVRTSARRSGSLLNAERTERVVESFNNPRARRIEIWLVRAFGVFLAAGGAIAVAT